MPILPFYSKESPVSFYCLSSVPYGRIYNPTDSLFNLIVHFLETNKEFFQDCWPILSQRER
ncbi:hypothetical protein CW304_21900 [Bacillus sp. UFRGS-B20]|nr:hypothetical protein CW304_21900 [Bacillus sp. UFRGS-B20]